MITTLILQLFLYFPEDKSEYLPASITMAVFIIGAIVTWRIIIKVSKKEAQQAKEFEEKLKLNSENDKLL
ncbi:hypothetical protein [Metabacillus iocasae]|uniref:Uncharacterized protein n=1 Tax=Priestia iocasae TaxID=2291674 RepID=A0ABS2QYT2_9BACI|nr:hypothetical protein [Metabacillus iocasae]MBM7704631.1 hypothetical protein [Metabacillus iocasae]